MKKRKREGGSGIKWKVEIKKERMEIYRYTCVVEKKEEGEKKKKRKRMDERKEKKKK